MPTIRSSRREPSTEKGAMRRTSLSVQLAGWILLSTAVLAPWIAGAVTTFATARWWLAGALTSAFFLVVFGRLLGRRSLHLPLAAILPAIFLLGCLGWWATQEDLLFVTAFSAEHWAFLTAATPYSMMQWPRPERLGFLASLLFGFLAAIEVGRREKFRSQLSLVLGCSATAVAVYALGQAWWNWPNLPWTLINNGPEGLNVTFEHYSGPPAALNLAWPLLVFGVIAGSTKRNTIIRVAIIVVVAMALPLWDSAAGKAIAVGLLIAGFGWKMIAAQKWLSPSRVALAIAVSLAVVFVGQAWVIKRMHTHFPDQWVSAEVTQFQAETRDAEVRTRADKRGDHLVVSNVPDRPSAWLAAARMAADHLWIGAGPGSWVKRSTLYSHNPVISTFYHYCQYAHHDLLQFAAEWGGIPALAMAALWVGGLWRAVHRTGKNSFTEAGVVLALWGIALHSTVDFPLQNPALQLWTALLLGLAWSGTRTKSVVIPERTLSPRTEAEPLRGESRAQG